jgi:putative MFS transporter
MLESKIEEEYGALLPAPGEPEPIVTNGSFSEMWRPPYGKRAAMMIIFNLFQTVGFYGFMNWLPTLIIQQGINVTRSFLYSSIIAIAAPIGPAIGTFFADKFERRSVIVTAAGAIILFGLAFSQFSSAATLIATGVALTLANNVLSYSYYAYQAELFPTSIRARSVGFVYSWSRFSAIFTSFFIAAIVKPFGPVGVFVLIAAAMLIAMLAVALMGPPTRNLALERISH